MTLSIAISLVSVFFGSGILVSVVKYFKKRIKENDQKTEAVCLGVQALLRDRLIETYNKYAERGYAPIFAKENFENMWTQYHALGANGVMDEIHSKFQELPCQL